MSSQVVRRLQKMEENTFGAHAPNAELKKLNLSKPRETNSAPSRRGMLQHHLELIFCFSMEFHGLAKQLLKWADIMDQKL